MKDISGIEFEVDDPLKVIKEMNGQGFKLGEVVRCIVDDGTAACIFINATGVIHFYINNHLQKL